MVFVHFDSHCDTSDWLYDHSTPFRHAINEGLIDTDAYIQVDICDPSDDAEEQERAHILGARVLKIYEAFKIGIPKVVKTTREMMGDRRVYISLDIDAVDPAYAPGTGTPKNGKPRRINNYHVHLLPIL